MSFVLGTYARSVKEDFVKGKGCYLYTNKGEKYLDFVQGIAVNALGHCHDHLVKTMKEQADKPWHLSNLFLIKEQEKFAKRLCEYTKFDYLGLQNSGAEAVELLIKTARKYFHSKGKTEKNRILCINSSFHGRTMATISAGNNPKHIHGFSPLLEGFDHFEFGNHEQLRKAINDKTCAIMVEDTVLGEAGVKKIPTHCIKGLRDLCDEKNLLLCLDSVQSGWMRTGKFFAYEYAGIKPDLVAFAKAAGSGYPIGGCLFTNKVASTMAIKGLHGSTFAGNPMAMALANAVLDIVFEESFSKKVQDVSKYFHEKLNNIQSKFSNIIKEIRGLGLLVGIQLTEDPSKFMNKLLENKLITVKAADNVLRLLPPLIVTKEEIDEAIQILEKTCKEYKN